MIDSIKKGNTLSQKDISQLVALNVSNNHPNQWFHRECIILW